MDRRITDTLLLSSTTIGDVEQEKQCERSASFESVTALQTFFVIQVRENRSNPTSRIRPNDVPNGEPAQEDCGLNTLGHTYCAARFCLVASVKIRRPLFVYAAASTRSRRAWRRASRSSRIRLSSRSCTLSDAVTGFPTVHRSISSSVASIFLWLRVKRRSSRTISGRSVLEFCEVRTYFSGIDLICS